MNLAIQVFAYFLCISFLAFVDNGEKYKSRSLVFTLLTALLIFITGFRDGNLVGDYGTYKEFYEHGSVFIDPSFLFLRYLFNVLLKTKIEWLMLFYALLAISIKANAIKELTKYWYLSLMVFACDLLLLHEFTQIRAAVAVSFMLLSIKYILSRERIKFALCCISAILFHFSAIIIVPLWFLKSKKINIKLCFLLIFFSYILAILKFSPLQLFYYIPIPYINEKIIYYLQQANDRDKSANIFSLYFLIKLFLLSILLIKHKILIQDNKYAYIFLKIQFLSSISFLFLSQNVAAAARISEFYSSVEILLFPLISVVIKGKMVARLGLFAICVFMLCLGIFRYKLIYL